jgi:acyl carrier protein
MVRERLKGILASELDLPVDRVPEDASAETLEAWDSLGHMKVIMAVEQEWGVRFATAEIPTLNSIEKLAAALDGKGVR